MAVKKQTTKKKTTKKAVKKIVHRKDVPSVRRADLIGSLQAFDWGVLRDALRQRREILEGRGFHGYPRDLMGHRADMQYLYELEQKIAEIQNTFEPRIKPVKFKL